MKLLILIIVLSVYPGVSFARVPEWIANTLSRPHTIQSPDTEAVVLYAGTDVLHRRDTVTLHEQRIYQINRLEGFHYGALYLEVTKDTRVTDISGYRFDSSGKLLETLRRRDITRTAFSRHFHDDNEQVRAAFTSLQTGDIVAFEYQMSWKPFCPNLIVCLGNRSEVALIRIRIPDKATVVVLNDPDNRIQSDGNTWFVQNQPALPNDNNAPALRDRLPFIGIVFDKDEEISWNSISRNFYLQTHEVARLNDETKRSVQQLTSIPNQKDRIMQVINHVFDSIRYVAIEVGDGRFIPTPAEEVHHRKYGDCKDMAWYAIALLKEGGVAAHPVLSRTRSAGPVFESFPSFQFNHAVIAVELDSQTLDLKNIDIDGKPYLIVDLTDRFTSPPMLGHHIENTAILPVTRQGSTLLLLPSSVADKSRDEKTIHITLHANRKADISVKETLTGHFASREKQLREKLTREQEDKLYRDRVQRMLPGASIDSYTSETNENSVTTHLLFKAQNVGMDLNDLVYIMPNLSYSQVTGYRQRTRQTDLVKSYVYERHIEIIVDVGSGFKIESVPGDVTMENDFFSASIETGRQDTKIMLDIRISRHQQVIPEDRYSEYRSLYQDFLNSARSRIALSEIKNF